MFQEVAIQCGTQDNTRERRQDQERRNGLDKVLPQVIMDWGFTNIRTLLVLGNQSITKGNRLTFVKQTKQETKTNKMTDCSGCLSSSIQLTSQNLGWLAASPSSRVSELHCLRAIANTTPRTHRWAAWALALYPKHGTWFLSFTSLPTTNKVGWY